MNFTVRWTRAARDQLAAIWVASADRADVTSAAHRIELLLAADPESVGEERPPTRRILFESPLVVLYRVDAANARVIVSQVREY